MTTLARRRRVLVVGGGPAGLIAAETLGAAGCTVVIVDRMPSPGRKLLVAGRGGLNLTHSEALPQLLARYEPADPTLLSAIEAFPPTALRAWCDGLGEATFVGSSGRVFPASFRATPLLRAWLRRLGELGATFAGGHRLVAIGQQGHARFDPPLEGLPAGPPDATVLALGGASWPRTGSDGSWVDLVRAADVRVDALEPSDCGFDVGWTPVFRDRHAGHPLKNVALHHDGSVARGDVMITADGIEGSPVYALSGRLRRALSALPDEAPSSPDRGVPVTIDLRPDLDPAQLVTRLSRGRGSQSTSTYLRKAAGLSPVAVGLLREATGAGPLPVDSHALAARIKAVELRVRRPRPIGRAISSAGGIRWDEVDEHLMLRRIPGVFVAGEMLDWEAPTGGYLLQACFSTGVAAARGALEWLDRGPSSDSPSAAP